MNDLVRIGRDNLRIFKRRAFDVIELAEFARAEASETAQIIQMCKIVADSLKRNAEGIRWWEIFRKRRITRSTTVEGVMKGLTIQEVNEIALKVLELEGVYDSKKKEGEATAEATEVATSPITDSA